MRILRRFTWFYFKGLFPGNELDFGAGAKIESFAQRKRNGDLTFDGDFHP